MIVITCYLLVFSPVRFESAIFCYTHISSLRGYSVKQKCLMCECVLVFVSILVLDETPLGLALAVCATDTLMLLVAVDTARKYLRNMCTIAQTLLLLNQKCRRMAAVLK